MEIEDGCEVDIALIAIIKSAFVRAALAISSRFHKPVSDHGQDFGVRLVCIIESRGINEDDRIAISGM